MLPCSLLIMLAVCGKVINAAGTSKMSTSASKSLLSPRFTASPRSTSTLRTVTVNQITTTTSIAATQPTASNENIQAISDDPLAGAGPPGDGVLRGVNIGAWLVLEKWLWPEIFNSTTAVDQYTFDQTPGSLQKLQNHWATFFTQADVRRLASYGFNALRIPIGYWAYETYESPYHAGADEWLDKAITWARVSGMKVVIDLHGAPGSQNGFDNSGRSGAVEWQQPQNLERTTAVLMKMADKYGAKRYADVVFAIELLNEPISWDSNNFETTKRWTTTTYSRVLPRIQNPAMKLMMHDAFKGPQDWSDVHKNLNGAAGIADARFALDSHLYQVFVDADKQLDQVQHIAKACQWGPVLKGARDVNLPIYVGEWTAASDICVWPNGSTTAGSSCTGVGCQCENAPLKEWVPALVEQARRYVETQLNVWHSSSNGYFIWNFKGEAGPWSLYEGIEHGIFPNPIWSRKYPNACV